MTNHSKEYKEKVWDFLDTLSPKKKVRIDDIVKKENRQNFIDAVKEYFMFYDGTFCPIEFDANYEYVKKLGDYDYNRKK